jgi:hypothetical protein
MSTDESTTPKQDVYRKVTDTIITTIENGVGQYRMPWTVRQDRGFSPISFNRGSEFYGLTNGPSSRRHPRPRGQRIGSCSNPDRLRRWRHDLHISHGTCFRHWDLHQRPNSGRSHPHSSASRLHARTGPGVHQALLDRAGR